MSGGIWLEETYRGSEGIDNRRAYVVCNVDQPNVDNWLRTPLINVKGANRLHVEVTFTMRDCSEFPGNARSCKETFRLYAVQLMNNEEYQNVWNSNYWDLIDRITADTGQQSKYDSTAAVNQKVRSYTVTKDAVYFAFRDSDFYEVCPEIIHSFVHYPETVTGAEAYSIIAVNGKCIPNSSPVIVNNQHMFVKATGSWDMANGECQCNKGYASSTKYNNCTACPIESYKAKNGLGNCERCPEHSNTPNIGSSQCQCDVGYYRAEDEGPEFSCTQPPSKPSHIRVARIDEISATIEWGEPLMLGGRKELWYRYQCPECPITTIAHPAENIFTTQRLELTALKSGSTYTVLIFAENKVSKVATTVSQYALVEFTTLATVQSVSGLRIEGVQENGVTIAWKSMGTSKKNWFMKLIESFHNNSSIIVKTVRTYHTFESLKPQFMYSFRVRIVNEHGYGAWSEPLWYQPGRGLPVEPINDNDNDDDYMHNNSIVDLYWSSPVSSLWIWILLICAFLTVVLFTLLICLRQNRNRKRLNDCDGINSYKNGTLTPDFSAPISQGPVQNFFVENVIGAPLINYGSSQSTNYGETIRFKSYVDPAAYEDPNQALSEFTNDVDPSLIRITEVIGSGEFGEVCKGILQPCFRMTPSDISQVQTVAIKTLKPGSSDKAKSDFLMEASVMGQFTHENVIRLIGVVTKSEPIMIVIEYMENGSLDQFLRKNDNGILELVQIIDMLRGISAGMKYLTEKGFVHRDLAARNVLVDSNLLCKIADFGLSRGVEGSVEQEYTTNGGKIPVRWTAPEAITHRKFTAASDVWSFGVVMWEVCSFGERPYWDWTNQKVISEITLGYRLPSPMDTPVSLHNLIPTFAQILEILEEYVRQPALIYNDGICLNNSPTTNAGFSTFGTLPRSINTAASGTQLSLDEFLKCIGLAHCSLKLNMAGVSRVSDLVRLGHIDLLSYGLIAEEVQMIRNALKRSDAITTLQRTRNRPVHQRIPGYHHSSPQSRPAVLTSARLTTIPRVLSSVPTSNKDSFFV
ncbi:Receptor protein-tyrosine kinase [Dirofilaria immitis]|nr:Receptor protein-tyrosine kinase [Dirofilaria immitis]